MPGRSFVVIQDNRAVEWIMDNGRSELADALTRAGEDIHTTAADAAVAFAGAPGPEQSAIREKYRVAARERIQRYRAARTKAPDGLGMPADQIEEIDKNLRDSLVQKRGRPEPMQHVFFAALEELNKP
ncbi:MAG TPA: hypothetical protein VGL83_19875 [Stellaceae bacterium]|jgi:hypothetical protein